MPATQWGYMPVLKWKQGERIALRHVPAAHRRRVVPLIELQPIVATPDRAGLNAELPQYLEKIAKDLRKDWADCPIAVDTQYVAPAFPNQVRLLESICTRLGKLRGSPVIPVVGHRMLAETAGELGRLKGFAECVLRVMTPFVEPAAVADGVKSLVAAGLPRNRVHLMVDQFSMVGEVAAARWTVVQPYLKEAVAARCASVTLAGGSFPENLMGFKEGFKDVDRVEWGVWQHLLKLAEYKSVRYADYTVSNPAPIPPMEADKVNPSVSVRYTCPTFWRVYKARGFKGGGPNQLKNLCKLLVGDTVYTGETFSFGDASYWQAANDPSPMAKNGTPSSWRRDATSHHIALVVRDLGLAT